MSEKLQRRIFVFWTGDNEMSPARAQSLQKLQVSRCQVILVTRQNIDRWILQDAPLHPAFNYLSAVHRADYLRSYFMHHYGSGYSDVKGAPTSWEPAFKTLESSKAFGIGYPEVSPKGIAHIHRHQIAGRVYFGAHPASKLMNHIRYRQMRFAWRSMIGNGAYIFKPKTTLTQEWLETVEARLDILFPLLREFPATHPRAKVGDINEDGSPSRYPVPWAFLCADVLHPLVYRYRDQILQGVPTPDLKNYL
ncbi:MAG: hypothetical protein HWE23_07215 [Rhodobacteraceae bacterium]|nr:hypothetical protein [Paracoccaceae bacterium]